LDTEISVGDIITELSTTINRCNGITKFNICRANLWDGARRAVLRKTFVPESVISVKFTDDIGQAEGAVDEGGPRREFLQLAVDYLMNDSPVFVGPAESRHLSYLHDG